jgi:hypothetical protein
MKFRIVLTSLVLLLVSASFASALTLEQAKAYIVAHPDQAAQDIVNWDTVQHANPFFLFPEFAAVVLQDGGVNIIPTDKLKITIAEPLLMYDITIPPLHYPGLFKCQPGPFDWIAPAVIGTGVGIGLGALAVILIYSFAPH